MNKKLISPTPNQPIDRVLSGQLPSALAELTEVALSGNEHTLPAALCCAPCCTLERSAEWNRENHTCSFDGDD